MLGCAKATELIDKMSFDRLTSKEKIQLRLHLMFCKFCSRYQKQSPWLNKVLSKVFSTNGNKNKSKEIEVLEKKSTKK